MFLQICFLTEIVKVITDLTGPQELEDQVVLNITSSRDEDSFAGIKLADSDELYADSWEITPAAFPIAPKALPEEPPSSSSSPASMVTSRMRVSNKRLVNKRKNPYVSRYSRCSFPTASELDIERNQSHVTDVGIDSGKSNSVYCQLLFSPSNLFVMRKLFRRTTTTRPHFRFYGKS